MLEKVSNLVGGVVGHRLLTGRLLRKLFRQFQNAFGAEGESRSWTFKLPSYRGSETNVRTARRLSQLFPGSLGQSGCRLAFNAQPLDPRFRRLAAQEIVSTVQVRFATAQVAVSPPKIRLADHFYHLAATGNGLDSAGCLLADAGNPLANPGSLLATMRYDQRSQAQ